MKKKKEGLQKCSWAFAWCTLFIATTGSSALPMSVNQINMNAINDMGSLINQIGGLIDKPGDLKKEEIMQHINTVADSFDPSQIPGNMKEQISQIDLGGLRPTMSQGQGGPSGPSPFNFPDVNDHMMKVLDALGPMACLLGDVDVNDPVAMAGILGGMMGGMVGGSVGDMQTNMEAIDMEDTMSEMGAIAGMIGGISGAMGQGIDVQQLMNNPNLSMSGEMNFDQMQSLMKEGQYMENFMNSNDIQMPEFSDHDVQKLDELMGLAGGDISSMINQIGALTQMSRAKLELKATGKMQAQGGRFHSPCMTSTADKIMGGVEGTMALMGGILGEMFANGHGITKSITYTDLRAILQKATVPVIKFTKLAHKIKHSKRTKNGNKLLESCRKNAMQSSGQTAAFFGTLGAAIVKQSATMMTQEINKTGGIFAAVRPVSPPDRTAVRESAKKQIQKRNGRFAFFQQDGRQDLEKMTKCLNSIIPGMVTIELLQMMNEGLDITDFDYDGPMMSKNGASSRISFEGLPGVMMGAGWDGKSWSGITDQPVPLRRAAQLPDELLQHPEIIEYVNWLTGLDHFSEIYDYLSNGNVEIGSLSNDLLKEIPLSVLALYHPGLSTLTASNLGAILMSDHSIRNLTALKEFMEAFPSSVLGQLLHNTKALFMSGDIKVQPRVSAIVANKSLSDAMNIHDDLSGTLKIQLCAYYNGIDPKIWRDHVQPDLDQDVVNSVVDCANQGYFTMSDAQLSAIFDFVYSSVGTDLPVSDTKYLINHISANYTAHIQPSDVLQMGEQGMLDYILPNTKAGFRTLQMLQQVMYLDAGVLDSTINIQLLKGVNCYFGTLQFGFSNDIVATSEQTCQETMKRIQNNDALKCDPKFSVQRCKDFRKPIKDIEMSMMGFNHTRRGSYLATLPPHAIATMPPNEVLGNFTREACKQLSYFQKRSVIKSVIANQSSFSTFMSEESLALLDKCLWSAVNPTDLGGSIRYNNAFLQDFSEIFENFPSYAKFVYSPQLISDTWDAEAARSLPLAKLIEVTTNTIWPATKIRFHRFQAMKLVEVYKQAASKNDDPLSAIDVMSMNKLANGISCVDISKIGRESIVRVSIAIHGVLNGKVPAELAECIAVRVFLLFRGVGNGDYASLRDVIKRLPPSVNAFMPQRVLRMYENDCNAGFDFKPVRKYIGAAVPQIPSLILLQDMSYFQSWCQDENYYGGGPSGPYAGPGGQGGPHDGPGGPYGGPGGPYGGPGGPHDGPGGPYGGPMSPNGPQGGQDYPYAGSNSQYRSSIDQGEYGNEEYLDNEDLRKEMNMDDERGDCFTDFRPDMISECYNKMPGHQAEQLKTEFMKGLMEHIPLDNLYMVEGGLAKNAALLDKDELKSIPNEVLVQAFDKIRPMPEKDDFLADDKTLTEFDFFQALEFEIPEGQGPPRIFKRNKDPFDRRNFYEVAVEKMVACPRRDCNSGTSGILVYDDLVRLADGIRYIPPQFINAIPAQDFLDAIPLLGKVREWSSGQATALRTKFVQSLSDLGLELQTLPAKYVREMRNLISIFPGSSVAEFVMGNDDDLNYIHFTNSWPQQEAADVLIAKLFGEMSISSWSDLGAPELILMGNLLCYAPPNEIYKIPLPALRDAISYLGKLRCLSGVHLNVYATRAFEALSTDFLDKSNTLELGVLVGGLNSDKFVSISSFRHVSPNAFRVAAGSKILALTPTQLAKMGQKNANVVMYRPDVFRQMTAAQKNAVFTALMGLNAGEYTLHIQSSRQFGEITMEDFSKNMDKIMQDFYEILRDPSKSPYSGTKKPMVRPTRRPVMKPGGIYGLGDASQAVRPTPPPLATGLSQNDVKNNFDVKYLNDRVVVEYINELSQSGDSAILDVMKGEKPLSEISKEEFISVPAKVLQGLKKNDLATMSPEQLFWILDSQEIADDPASLKRIIKKFHLEKLMTALEASQVKMDKTGWRPPIAVQKVVSQVYLSHRQTNQEEAAANFLRGMCPYAAGISPGKINRLPPLEDFTTPFVNCMDKSYSDLTNGHRNAIVRFVLKSWGAGRLTAAKLKSLRNFALDVSFREVKTAFRNHPEEMENYVKEGGMLLLSVTHKNFKSHTTYILRNVFLNNKQLFDNKTFLDNLGPSQCNIPLRQVKRHMSSNTIRHFAKYTMHHCESEEDLLHKEMKQCEGEEAHRLQRCQFMKKDIQKKKQKAQKKKKKKKVDRVDLHQFQMMRELADTLLEEKDLSKVTASEVREVAGVLGGLKPTDLDKIPETALLDNLDVIKNNTNLTPKQKRKIMKKMESAGLDMGNLKELGPLVVAVDASKLREIAPEELKKNMEAFRDNAQNMNRAQRQAIVEKLGESSMDDLLTSDIGDLAADIPLESFESIETVNITAIKNTPWKRGQAAELLKIYRKNHAIDLDAIKEMGTSVVGLQCAEIMKIEVDQMFDAGLSIDEGAQGGMPGDLDDCIAMRMHYSMQVVNGMDYLETTDADVAAQVSTMPGNFAMFYMPNDLAKSGQLVCSDIMESIGQAQLYLMPPGAGDSRRKKIAHAALHNCLVDSSLSETVSLDEEKIPVLGQLLCDLEPSELATVTDDNALMSALPYLQECLTRLSTDQIASVQGVIMKWFGSNSSTYDVGRLTAMGPLVTVLQPELIEYLDNENVLDVLDLLLPPEVDEESPIKNAMNLNTFYTKVKEAVFSQRVDTSRPRRFARILDVPTFDEIQSMGPANEELTITQLEGVTPDDLVNSLGTLGAISTWSDEKATLILRRLNETLGVPGTWTDDVVGDVNQLIRHMSLAEINTLDVSDIETCEKLSAVELTNVTRSAIIERYLDLNNKQLGSLETTELISLGALVCGLSVDRMIDLPISKLGAVVKNFGELSCFDQDQFDTLEQIALFSRRMEMTPGFVYELGTIAAGMSSAELHSLSSEALPFINSEGLILLPAERIKNGLNSTQLLAIGVSNAAALISKSSTFNALSPFQRNALRLVAYGSEAELEDEPEGAETITNVFESSLNLTQLIEEAFENQESLLNLQTEDDGEEEIVEDGAIPTHSFVVTILAAVTFVFALV